MDTGLGQVGDRLEIGFRQVCNRLEIGWTQVGKRFEIAWNRLEKEWSHVGGLNHDTGLRPVGESMDAG